MNRHLPPALVLSALVALSSMAACGSGGGGPAGSGGASGTGGRAAGTGGAGAVGSGGASGGASSTGGTTGTGGGAPATGGMTATGGAATTGGVPGSGGAAAGTGGMVAATGGASGRPGTGGGGGRGTGGATGGVGGTAGGAAGATGCLTFGPPTQVGTIESTTLNGPSGMVASRAHPGVLWAHLDAGGPATVFAMTIAGKALGEYTLTGATAMDWEDISVGPGPMTGMSYLYVGDIGDNSSTRTQIQIYRLPEPNVTTTQTSVQMAVSNWQVLRFTYPDGAHNAETLMIDPLTGDMLILTKDTSGASSIFRAPGNTAVDTPTVLTKAASVQFAGSGQGVQAGAGDISPTGDRFMVRTYTAILLWPRAGTLMETFAAAPRTTPSPTEPQGEGLSFAADGKSWISTGEQARAIYQGVATCP